MNSKSFINYFPEIASLDESEQETLLEQARYAAFAKLNLSGQSALFFIGSLLAGFSVPVLTLCIFGYSILSAAIASGLGCVLALILHKKLYGKLIKKGLDEVLKSNAT
uniref:hypothetical protein n=1 Tax=Alteromonas sp. S015 TaxID=3117401 RepID=UPI002FE0A44C